MLNSAGDSRSSDPGTYGVSYFVVKPTSSGASATFTVTSIAEEFNDSNSSGLSGGAIAGIVIALIVLVVFLGALVTFLIYLKYVRASKGMEKN